MDNKRRNKRFNCLVPVETQENGAFGHAKTIDFSRGGLGFICLKELPLNKQVAIELELPGEKQSVIVQGKVRWVEGIAGTEKYRIGLSFENIFHGSKTMLNKYFRKLEGKRYAFRY